MTIEEQIETVKASGFLDEAWYLETYRDVAALGMSAAEHFVKYGAVMGRDPGPDFSTRDYLDGNHDVADKGLNPLLHYIRHGRDEGRRIVHSQEI